jgi:hypothetical protein
VFEAASNCSRSTVFALCHKCRSGCRVRMVGLLFLGLFLELHVFTGKQKSRNRINVHSARRSLDAMIVGSNFWTAYWTHIRPVVQRRVLTVQEQGAAANPPCQKLAHSIRQGTEGHFAYVVAGPRATFASFPKSSSNISLLLTISSIRRDALIGLPSATSSLSTSAQRVSPLRLYSF